MSIIKRAIIIIEGWWNYVFKINLRNATERQAVCMSCKHYTKKTTFKGYKCGLCGCDIKAKTASPSSKCPINKW